MLTNGIVSLLLVSLFLCCMFIHVFCFPFVKNYGPIGPMGPREGPISPKPNPNYAGPIGGRWGPISPKPNPNSTRGFFVDTSLVCQPALSISP